MKIDANMHGEKVCRKCFKTLPLTEFWKCSRKKDGRTNFCIKCQSAQHSAWHKQNKERRKSTAKSWRIKNREKIKAYAREYRKRTITVPTDEQKILAALRTRTRSAIRGVKSKSTKKLLGCSIDFFIQYIESLFWPGMSWDNYGKPKNGEKTWVLDHIKPCIAFNLTDPAEQRKCFNYLNLQPLWWHDNAEKSDKLNHTVYFYGQSISVGCC